MFEKPRMLELFCGRKCIGEVFKKKYDMVSLDYNPKFNATHTEDILEWDYKQYEPETFEVIWASPDCTTWSLASGGKYRRQNNIYSQHENGQKAERMIIRLLEMIEYFKPKMFFIENPRGLLQHFPPMKDLESKNNKTLVYYGNYNWGFPKATHIWSNIKLWENEKTPDMPPETYKLFYHNYDKIWKRFYYAMKKGNAESRSLIPPLLVEKIYSKVNEEINNNTKK